MASVNLFEATERFGLIDAELLEFRCQPGKDGLIEVSFYPFWEHPIYQQAIESGKQWVVRGREAGAKVVRVRVEGVHELRLSRRDSIREWSAPVAHEALFRFEAVGELLVESEFEPRELRKRLRARHMDFASENTLLGCCGYGRDLMPPVSLGELPASLFHPVRDELFAMGVEFEILRTPPSGTPPQMLMIDGHDYVIADRFVFEIPEFEHHADWVLLQP